jgi:outer membrane protein assembly factor BamA
MESTVSFFTGSGGNGHSLAAHRVAVAALALLILSWPAWSQQSPEQAASSYAGQTVSSVDVAGRPGLTFKNVQNLILLKQGQPLVQNEVDATVAALKQNTGAQNVNLNLLPEADGVRVIFILQPAVYVGMYEFPGALREFAYARLLQVADYNSQMPYSANDVEHAENALVQFFRQQGYFLAEVHPEVEPVGDSGLVNVLFRTDLGVKAKIGGIHLAGASANETDYLQRRLGSVTARFRGASVKPGMRYSAGRLRNATRYMQSALAGQGHIAADVKLASAEYDPATNRADITFRVTTGPVVRIRTEGAHLWSFTAHKLIPMYQENAVNDDLIREGQNNLLSYFQSKGYFETKVDVNVAQNPDGMSVVYDITKDGRYKVTKVGFAGNQRFNNQELQSHVSVEEGHFFSHGKYSDDLVRRSTTNLRDTYRAAGYSQAEVVPKVARNKGDIEVIFQVTENPVDLVKDLKIEGNKAVSEADFAPNGMNLGPGKAYSQELVAKDRSQIMARYLTLGYLNATFHSKATLVPGEPHRLNVLYRIDEGPQVKTATIITDGRQHTRQSLIERQLKISAGEPLSENALLSSESHLYNLEIFDWAEVAPKATITEQSHEDVVVKVHEAKRNTIVYGFGFQVLNRGGNIPSGTVVVPGLPPVGLPTSFKPNQQTFWGPDGTFEYTRRNLRGRAEYFVVSAYAGRLDQRLDFAYTQPSLRNSSWKGSAILSAEHNATNPIFTARIGNLGYQLQKPLNAKKTTNLFLRYNFQLTRISNLLIPELVPPNQLNVHLSTLSASWIHDTRDNVLDAHRGIYETVQFGVNPAWLGSNFSFAQFLGQAANYKNIGNGIIWANSIRLGLEQAYAGSEVPLSQRFFTGGGTTLRGFPLNSAGPQRVVAACTNPADPSTCSKITVPAGGNQLLLLNSELRFPLDVIKKGLGIVTFYDGGNVFPNVGFHNFTSLYSNNVGVGLRYATPVGPIRIDVGHNLNPVPGISTTQVFVTLGQAF